MHPVMTSSVRLHPRWMVAATVTALCAVLTMEQPVEVARAHGAAVVTSSTSPTPEDVSDAVASTLQAAATMARALPRGPDRLGVSTSRTRWQWPLLAPQVVMAHFDGPVQRWLPGHRGVDLAGFEGAPVRVVADGVVSFSGVINGVGVISVIHPDGVLSTYQPVLTSSSKGEQVRTGDMIGTLAAQGSHCWPLICLHLGARRDKEYLDPMMFLRPWVVALLPPSR